MKSKYCGKDEDSEGNRATDKPTCKSPLHGIGEKDHEGKSVDEGESCHYNDGAGAETVAEENPPQDKHGDVEDAGHEYDDDSNIDAAGDDYNSDLPDENSAEDKHEDEESEDIHEEPEDIPGT